MGQIDDLINPRGSAEPVLEPKRRKQVRFSELDETQVFERDKEEEPEGAGQLRTVLPGDDDLDDDERLYKAEHVGPVKDVDPEAAAKRRAAKRQQSRALVASSLGLPTDVPEHLADAEEDDPREAVGWNEAGQPVPLEPFNLLREREEGYFNAEGNYVEYRLQGLTDAWLEGLEQAAGADDTTAAGKTKKRRRSGGKREAAEDPEQAAALDAEERAAYKRRIVQILQPGETVLQALRRLANMGGGQQQRERQRGGGRRGARTGGGGRAQGPGAQEGGGDESDEDEGASNVSTQLQQGNSGMRQRLRKIFKQQEQRQQEQGQQQNQQQQQEQQQEQQQAHQTSSGGAGAPAAALTAASATAQLPSASRGPASTSQDEGQGVPARATAGDLAATCGSAGTGEREAALQERPGVSSPKHPGTQPKPAGSHSPLALSTKLLGPSRRVPVENSVEFDKLTSYADILLGQCDFDIYSRTREQLLQEVAGSGGSAPAALAAVLAQQDAGAGVQAPAAAAGAGDDDDMFGEEFEVQAREAASHAAELPSSTRTGEADAEREGGGAAVSTAQQGAEPDTAQGADQALGLDPGRAASGPPDVEGDGDMQGFVLDPDSGLLYNSLLGYYFDPSRMVWRDAWTGLQYRMDEAGQYIKLSQEEQMKSSQEEAAPSGLLA